MKKPIELDKLTQRRVTVPLIMILGVLVLGWRADSLTVGYLSEFFLTKAIAEEQYASISKQVAANAILITGHIRTYELNENARDTNRVQDSIYDLELYVSANGENDLTRNRKRDLNNTLTRLGRVRACIIRNAPNENCSSII